MIGSSALARLLDCSTENSFRGLQGKTAAEDGEAPEERLLVGIEQVVAPGDGRAHAAQACRLVARAAGQQRQHAVEPCQQLRRRKHLDAGGGQLNREWQAVHLENEFLRVMVLPEIGGRIHVGLDKTNGYDFFYRQNVIKPALVGIAGSSVIEDDVVLAGQVGVINHVRVGAGAQVASKSAVMFDLEGGQTYAGIPAVPINQWRRWAVQFRKGGKGPL